MSTNLMLHILEHSQQRGSTKLLLLAIAKFSNDDGTGASPSIATLAHLIGTKPRNVQYLLRDLEQSGDLLIDYHGGPDGCNRYTIVVSPVGEPACDITNVQWDAEPPVHPVAPMVHSRALQEDAATCTQLKERKKDGAREHAHPRNEQELSSIPTPPGERPLHADPMALWQTGRASVQPLDEAQLRTLAADLDGPTGGYGCYWLGRGILAGNACDPTFATNPRALNLVRAILRRWKEEQSFGSDTRAYQSRLEQRHEQSRPSGQRLAAPIRHYSKQPDNQSPSSQRSPSQRPAATTACTIIGYDTDCNG